MCLWRFLFGFDLFATNCFDRRADSCLLRGEMKRKFSMTTLANDTVCDPSKTLYMPVLQLSLTMKFNFCFIFRVGCFGLFFSK